jgi:hypothetical protein
MLESVEVIKEFNRGFSGIACQTPNLLAWALHFRGLKAVAVGRCEYEKCNNLYKKNN